MFVGSMEEEGCEEPLGSIQIDFLQLRVLELTPSSLDVRGMRDPERLELETLGFHPFH